MNTQQMSDNENRPTKSTGDRALDSILRTLTVAVALLVFGFSAPMVFADHMGNHERGSAGSAECGDQIPSKAATGEVSTNHLVRPRR